VQFKILVENQFSCSIKTMQLDGGTEFLPIIRSNPQIQYHVSCSYTPSRTVWLNENISASLNSAWPPCCMPVFHTNIGRKYLKVLFLLLISYLLLPSHFKSLFSYCSKRLRIISFSRYLAAVATHTLVLMQHTS
jgi:hypothetical protein